MSHLRHTIQYMSILPLHWRENIEFFFRKDLSTSHSQMHQTVKAIEIYVFYERSGIMIYEKGVTNATLYFKIYIRGRYTYLSLCVCFYLQETGYHFELHFKLFPVARLLEKIFLPWRLIRGENPGFPPFSGIFTNRAHTLTGVKRGLL